MLHMPQEIPDRGSNSWHLTNCFAFWDPVCRVNIAGCTFLGSKACFPHLTFAYITICQAQLTALQLFTHEQNSARARLRCLPATAACVWESRAGAHSPPLQLCQSKLALQYPLLFCCRHFPGGNLHCSVAFVREREHEPASYPPPKRREARKLRPLQNPFPGTHSIPTCQGFL